MDANPEGFIGFLKDYNLMEFDLDGNIDEQFTNRLKLQKYVLLAKRFGIPFHYLYNMYLGSLANAVDGRSYEHVARICMARV